MKSTSTLLFILGYAFLTIFSGCGSLTKMRYSRGFKSNLEFHLGKKEKQGQQQIAAKAVKKQNNNRESITPDIPQTTMPSEETTVTSSITKTKASQKTVPAFKKHSILKSFPIPKINKKISSVNSGKPIEPTTAVAGALFYLGLILSVLFNYSALFIPSIFSLIASIMLILGFILAIVGVGKIKRSNYEYSGMGLDVSIIVIFSLMILLLLAYIVILFLILSLII